MIISCKCIFIYGKNSDNVLTAVFIYEDILLSGLLKILIIYNFYLENIIYLDI